MKRISITLLLLCISLLLAKSQIVKEKQFAFAVGNQGAFCDSFPDAENLDFLNYIYRDRFTGNLAYIVFSGYFKFSDSLDLNIEVGMYSDLVPAKYNFTLRYFPIKNIGFGFSFLGYPQYLNEFNLYHWNTDVELFADLDSNYRQYKMYNMGLGLGPAIRFANQGLTFYFSANAGIRWVEVLETNVYQKAIDGNFRRTIHYKTRNNPNFYLFPEVTLGVKLFSFSSTVVGIKIRSAAELSRRSMKYTYQIADWTASNSETITVRPVYHNYLTYEVDFGIYLRW